VGERVYQKRGTWYGWFYDRAGKRKTICLWTKDKRTAQLKLRREERQAHGEDHNAADAPPWTIVEAVDDWLAHGLVGKSPDTVDYYRSKSGHLNRILGNVDVNALAADRVAKYITQRNGEEFARMHTIKKEMTALRQCLAWAKKHGRMVNDPRALVPEIKDDYVPRKRFLRPDEFEQLVASFKRKHRRDWLLVCTYTGGRQGEVERLSWPDVDLSSSWLTLPGTKTRKARRPIPIHDSLRAVLVGIKRRKDGLVVGPWEGVVEDLRKKCLELELEKVSPNDLRRTFASWLVQRGTPLKVVADLLGHTSTVMVERVYGHLINDNLRDAVRLLPRRRLRVARR
jgi:integrase